MLFENGQFETCLENIRRVQVEMSMGGGSATWGLADSHGIHVNPCVSVGMWMKALIAENPEYMCSNFRDNDMLCPVTSYAQF